MVLRSRERGRVGHRRLLIRQRLRTPYGGVRHFSSARCAYLCPMTHAGIVTVAGKPNAGKSTLLNRVVGQKLSIVSAKPQSTRDRIVGIRTEGDVQMIVLDTPGLLNPRYPLQRAMRGAALAALDDADVVLYLVDVTEDGDTVPELAEVAQLQHPPRSPVVLAINKVDQLP